MGLIQTFGVSIEHPLADVVVRGWGFLIAMVGGLLIYGAYQPQSRNLILVIAIIRKLAFIFLNLIDGQAYIDKSIVAIIFYDVLITLNSTFVIQSKYSQD
jgi:hypothetical protein